MSDQQPTVDFRCTEADEPHAVPPVPVRDVYSDLVASDWVRPDLATALQRDGRIEDAVLHGWYLYVPEPIMFTESPENNRLSAYSGDDFVRASPDTEDLLKPTLTAFIDTAWHLSVPDEYVVLVTSPLYTSESPVRSTLFTADQDWPRVTLPVTVTSEQTLHTNEPVAQAMVLSRELIDTDEYGIGAFDDRGQKAFTKRQGLAELHSNPYEDRIRNPKAGTSVTGEDDAQ